MKPFWALRIHADEGGEPFSKLEQIRLENLTPGEVVIEVHYSGVNYKDALAGTGKGRILKRFPLNGGIDASGVVIESTDPRFRKGQEVLVNGCGIGENFDGGYAEVLRVQADSVVPLPKGLSLREAMILGTAGFTAALALHRMEQNGQTPAFGPILVTGASGGVGSFAVQVFSQNGYEVHAVSGKHEAVRHLMDLGAKQVIPPEQLGLGDRPLEKVRYGGAVDNVGGKLLSQVLAHIQLWGNVASIGLAESAELHTTVMPFILRGVSLLGTSSNNCTREVRHELWNKLAGPWRPKNIDGIVARTVELKDLVDAFDDLLHRRVQGRILVEIRK
jgi:putative YhdH/YhfP family quinone oxidoreductase